MGVGSQGTFTDLLLWDVKEPTPLFERLGEADSGGVANLNGLWDWVGMAPCMGPLSPVCAYSLWAGLCPEKLVKKKNALQKCDRPPWSRFILTWIFGNSTKHC